MKNFKQHIPKMASALIVIFLIFAITAICLIHAIPAGEYINFNPTNGTFQNYNPVRRFLDGQIPYKDFTDYLGIGHLLSGSFATLLLGGDYQASLIAFLFLTLLSFALISVAIGKSITNSWKLSTAVTSLILVSLVTAPEMYSLFLSFSPELKKSVLYPLSVGNSARFIRGMVLPISCFMLIGASKLVDCISEKKSLSDNYAAILFIVISSAISGFSFIWSNDYGISCWVCFLVMTVFLSFSRHRKIKTAILSLFTAVIVSAVSVFIIITIISHGHFSSWLSHTFGNGGYQAWYYNSNKSYYLWDVDFAPVMLVQAAVTLIYLGILFFKRADKNSIIRFGIPAFANMTGFCAANEYRMLSGGHLRHVALCVLFLTVVFEIANLVIRIKPKFFTIIVLLLSVSVPSLWIYINIQETAQLMHAEKDGTYFETLGGYMTWSDDDILQAEEFLGDKTFFATYASAQEAVHGIYQPTGTDYIIHVLGDEQREHYLDVFHNGDFDYFTTLYPKNHKWEHWAQRSNWFIYRELHRDWHPVFANRYEVYWERNNSDDNFTVSDNINVTVEDIDEKSKKIIVTADENVSGLADVFIDYKVLKADTSESRFLIRKMLRIQNTGHIFAQGEDLEGNNLPDESREYTPVTVVNGYGEAIITSMPDDGNTILQLNDVYCSDIYTVSFNHVKISSFQEQDGSTTLFVSADPRNSCNLQNAKTIKISDSLFNVLSIKENGDYIEISVQNSDTPISVAIEKCNMAEIIK